MPIENKVQLTIEELKTIIHGLRMSTFSFVEDNAMIEIGAMIKALPSSEEIDKLAGAPKAIKNLQTSIGNIMQLIEAYGKRDVEYKVRYRSRTNLPPRYKVLDWRGAMKSREELKASLITGMVRVSSDLDRDGYSELSQSMIDCAKGMQCGKMPLKDLYNTTRDIVSVFSGKDMVKEAQYKGPAELDLSMDEIHNSIAQINKMLQGLNTAFQNKVQYLGQIEKTKAYGDQLSKIWQQIGVLAPVLSDVDKQAATVEQTMNQQVPLQSIAKPGSPTQNLQYIPDPENPSSGWDIAVTQTQDGSWKEVQVDEQTGKYYFEELTPLKIPGNLAKGGNPLLQPDVAKYVLDYVMQKAAGSYGSIIKAAAPVPQKDPSQNQNAKLWVQYIDSIIKAYPNHYKLFLQPIIDMLKKKTSLTPQQQNQSQPAEIPMGDADTSAVKTPSSAPPNQQSEVLGNIPQNMYDNQASSKFNLKMHKIAKKR